MTTLSSIGAGTYSGTLTIVPAAVPDGATTAYLQIECSRWTDAASSVEVAFELSQDGDETWQPWCSGIFTGGALDRQRQPLAVASMGGGLPAVSERQLRGMIQITGNLVTQSIMLAAD